MPIQNTMDLLLALERGAFNDVLGSPELEGVEFKEAPYRLDERHQKWELAKDVAALANRRGGAIVFGFRTSRAANQLVDTVTEHRPVPKNLVSWDSCRNLLQSWVRPAVEGLAGRWFPDDPQADHGTFALIVPPQPDESKYFVVSAMVDGAGGLPGALGIPVRHGDAVEWLTAEAVHSLVREALWFRRRGPGPVLAARVAPEAQGAIGQARISERVQAVEAAGGWSEIPFFALHAVPDPPWSRPDDFYSDQGLKGRLAEPRALRRDGFHIWSGAAPELLADGSISCATDRRIVWLSDDGFFTAAARGDEEFLGWYYNQRRPADAPMVVNPRVLAEYVLEFCLFVHSELKPRAAGTWTLFLSTVGFDRSGGLLLAPALGRGGNGLYFPGMARNEYRPLRPNDQRSVLSGASAGDDAYRILVEFYALFGAPPDEIPYARGREISAESIRGQ